MEEYGSFGAVRQRHASPYADEFDPDKGQFTVLVLSGLTPIWDEPKQPVWMDFGQAYQAPVQSVSTRDQCGSMYPNEWVDRAGSSIATKPKRIRGLMA
ncbi:hypothetical protein CSOJ01_01203 [Colletotrichum sojae]|uniref:Uncharacterized protein n=1 Tax=Colletotrichum sojae TaxID=2175907 RepID=A0A8H6N532_9PEZI|nr:hypothetical protein CSOJ01_01203 [Colletotrichum sojae]